MNNYVLRTSFLGNRIYLGTLSKSSPGSLNNNKRDMTDEAVKAVFQFMQANHLSGHDCIEINGIGRIVFEPWGSYRERKIDDGKA